MADNANRRLRTRRPPQYLVGDNSDPELFGYARTTYTKDFMSPAQELNSFAKTLAKFVNSANKRRQLCILDLSEKLNVSLPKQGSMPKNRTQVIEEEVKKPQQNIQMGKRKQIQKYEGKEVSTKVNKDNGGLKQEQPQQNVTKEKTKTQEAYKKQLETMKNTKQAIKNDYYPNINYINKLQQIKQQQGFGIGNVNKTQSDAAARAIQQQQQILNYNPALREKLQAQNSFQAKTQQSNEKFFRRSSYHVAIAYHIHLNNIKQGGRQMQTPMNIDPTYYAKKLRGEYDHQ